MLRYFCCLKKEPTLRHASDDSSGHRKIRKSVRIKSSKEVKDLLNQYSENDKIHFHNAISVYEAAMRLQRDIEFAFVHRDHREVSLIQEIYESPQTYIDSNDEGIRAVARNLQYVQACSDIVSDLELHASYRDSTRLTAVAHESRIQSSSSLSFSGAITNPLAHIATNLADTPVDKDSDDEDGDTHNMDRPLSYDSKLYIDFQELGLTTTALSDEISPPSMEVQERRHRNSSRLQIVFDERMGNDLSGIFQPPLDVINFVTRDTLKNGKITTATDVTRYSTSINMNEFDEKSKPVWPDWLVDVKFDCYKINKMGIRKERTLLLTEYHILSMRKDSEIRMALKYMHVKKVFFKRPNKLIITNQFDHSMTFNSSAASHILQQIKSRIAARTALEEAGFFYSGLDSSTLKNYNKQQTGEVLDGVEENGLADRLIEVINPRALEKRVFGPFADALLLIAIKCRVKEAEDAIAKTEEKKEIQRIEDEKKRKGSKSKEDKDNKEKIDDHDHDDDDDAVVVHEDLRNNHMHQEITAKRHAKQSLAIISHSVALLDGNGHDDHIDADNENDVKESDVESEALTVTRSNPSPKSKQPPRKSVAAGLHKRSLRKSTADSIAKMGIISEEDKDLEEEEKEKEKDHKNRKISEEAQASDPHAFAENRARGLTNNLDTSSLARKMRPWDQEDINSLLTVLPSSEEEKVRQRVQALLTESNQTAARAIASFNSKFEAECSINGVDQMSTDLLRQVQSLSRGVYEYICQKHWNAISSIEPSELLLNDCNNSNGKVGSILCFVVWITIEEIVVGGLEHLITPGVTIRHTNDRMTSLSSFHSIPFSMPSRNVEQSDFDIPELMQSPRGWTNAIIALAGVYADAAPTRRVASLARTVNLIYEEHDQLMREINTSSDEIPVMGADELVPVFLYCFARAAMNHENVMVIISTLWNVTHPALRAGEVGYLITVLESAAVIYNEEFASLNKNDEDDITVNKIPDEEELEEEIELEKEIQRRSSVRGSITLTIPDE